MPVFLPHRISVSSLSPTWIRQCRDANRHASKGRQGLQVTCLDIPLSCHSAAHREPGGSPLHTDLPLQAWENCVSGLGKLRFHIAVSGTQHHLHAPPSVSLPHPAALSSPPSP